MGKYYKGTQIDSITELVYYLRRNEMVYCRHKVYHPGFLMSWHIRTILIHLDRGHFYIARTRNGNG